LILTVFRWNRGGSSQQLLGPTGAGVSGGDRGRQHSCLPGHQLGAAAAKCDQLLPHVTSHHRPYGGSPGNAARHSNIGARSVDIFLPCLIVFFSARFPRDPRPFGEIKSKGD